jgi:hypothetical protein
MYRAVPRARGQCRRAVILAAPYEKAGHTGAETDERMAITAATYRNVTVVMLNASPLAPDNTQHPNPAVAQISDDIGNTVTWKGMSPP